MMFLKRYRATLLWVLSIIMTAGYSYAAGPSCRALMELSLYPLSAQYSPKTGEEPAKVLIKDPQNPQYYASGTVTSHKGRNFLQMTLILKTLDGQRSAVLRGHESVRQIIAEFESRGIKIDAFKSTWNDRLKGFDGPSDNLISFMKTYRDAITRQRGSMELPDSIDYYFPKNIEKDFLDASIEAARSTWSGKQALALGFKHIEAIFIREYIRDLGADHRPGAIDVEVVWAKDQPPEPIIFEHTRTYGDSSLPRFHQMIENLIPN